MRLRLYWRVCVSGRGSHLDVRVPVDFEESLEDNHHSDQTIMRRILGLFIAGKLCSAIAAQSTPSLSSEEAAVRATILQEQSRMEATECGQRAGSMTWAFEFGEFFWETKHHAQIEGAHAILESLAADRHQALQGRIDSESRRTRELFLQRVSDDAQATCQAVYSRLNSTAKSFDELAGPAATALENAFVQRAGSAESARVAVRDTDILVGCVKSSQNHGQHDLSKAQSTCTCVRDALVASGTTAEVDDYLRHAGAALRDPNAAQLPLLKAATPRIQQCQKL